MVNKIVLLEQILENHISSLAKSEEDPTLNDSKQLTELLKAVQLLETIKRDEGTKSIYDGMSVDALEKALDDE